MTFTAHTAQFHAAADVKARMERRRRMLLTRQRSKLWSDQRQQSQSIRMHVTPWVKDEHGNLMRQIWAVE